MSLEKEAEELLRSKPSLFKFMNEESAIEWALTFSWYINRSKEKLKKEKNHEKK